MSLKPYPKYKDSGVEWLGEVPEHWDVKRLRQIFDIRKRIAGSFDFDVLSVTQQGLKVKDIESNDGQLSSDYSKYQIVNPGDFAMNHMDLLTGYVGLSDRLGVTSPDYRVFELHNASYSPYYFLRLLQNAYHRQLFFPFGQGSSHLGRWRLPTDQFNEFIFPVPPVEEQNEIAKFLDRETTKIDALIAEQQKLIALLAEKRQATITHAVTKGLNPTAKMKDSGVEWLGEVPEHWGTVSLKHVAAIQYGIGEPPVYREEGIPLIRATNVDAGRIREKGMVFVDPSDIPEKRIVWLQSGDIIVVRSGAYTGDSALVKQEHCPAIAGFDMVLRPHGVAPEFLQYSLLSRFLKEGQIDLQKMRAAQPHLNAEEIGSCVMLLPPAEEQSTIIETLNKLCDQIDALAADAGRAIDLLKERRTALISAAVTGKIDVRGVVEPEKAAA